VTQGVDCCVDEGCVGGGVGWLAGWWCGGIGGASMELELMEILLPLLTLD
jgi:L-aminopeptidase/D-esterase-like protein